MERKICHVTNVHSRYDVRIFQKECKTLLNSGYSVYLIVNDIHEDEVKDGIHIVSSKLSFTNRYERIFHGIHKIKKKAIEIDADIYHLHDPELLLIAPYLKRKGKKVVFDSHEDYASTLSVKTWIPKILRPAISRLYVLIEHRIIKNIDGAIVCYHWTEDRYKQINGHVSMVLNFPIIINTHSEETENKRTRSLAFAGGISEQWCHHEVLTALESIDDITYRLAGSSSEGYLNQLKKMKSWKNVVYYGEISHKDVFEKIYHDSTIGIVLLDYIPQCKYTVGNLSNTKLFEVMYAGLPLICTDFDLWRTIVEEEDCGICINPHNVDEIQSAIEFILNNPEIAKRMGKNGNRAVLEKYNWETEARKLIKFYEKL